MCSIIISKHTYAMPELELTTPKFPDWNETIIHLFKSEIFKSAGLNSESMTHYLNQLKTLKTKYKFPINQPDMMVQSFEMSSQRNMNFSDLAEEEFLNDYKSLKTNSNQFTLVGDAQSMDFIKIDSRVKDILNLPDIKEFNLSRICGLDNTFELYHPEDVIHTIRLGLCTLLTASVKGIVIDPFLDYYQIEFRMGFKDEDRCYSINRICKLSNLSENKGTRHADVWTVEKGHSDFEHVKAKLEIKSNPYLKEISKALLFVSNAILLDLKPRDVVVANLLDKYDRSLFQKSLNEQFCESVEEVNLGFTSSECSDIRSNLIKKVDSRIFQNTMEYEKKSLILNRSLNFKCGQLGILQLPSLVEMSIFHEVR